MLLPTRPRPEVHPALGYRSQGSRQHSWSRVQGRGHTSNRMELVISGTALQPQGHAGGGRCPSDRGMSLEAAGNAHTVPGWCGNTLSCPFRCLQHQPAPQLGSRLVFSAGIEPPKPLFPLTGYTDPRQCQQTESLLPGSCWAGHRPGTGSKHSCVPQNTPAATPGMLSVGVNPQGSFPGVSPYLTFCCGAGTPSAAAAHFFQPGPGALGTGGLRCHRSPMPHRRAELVSLPGHWW